MKTQPRHSQRRAIWPVQNDELSYIRLFPAIAAQRTSELLFDLQRSVPNTSGIRDRRCLFVCVAAIMVPRLNTIKTPASATIVEPGAFARVVVALGPPCFQRNGNNNLELWREGKHFEPFIRYREDSRFLLNIRVTLEILLKISRCLEHNSLHVSLTKSL